MSHYPPIVTTVDSAFITGVAKADERLIILLDLNQVLTPEDKADVKAIQPVIEDEAVTVTA